jgi:hypothetical protein
MTVEGQIGDQRLQLPVLLPKLPQLAQLVQSQPGIPPLPTVERLLRHTQFAADIGRFLAAFGFAQRANNREFPVSVRNSEKIALCDPVMPVTDSFRG